MRAGITEPTTSADRCATPAPRQEAVTIARPGAAGAAERGGDDRAPGGGFADHANPPPAAAVRASGGRKVRLELPVCVADCERAPARARGARDRRDRDEVALREALRQRQSH